MSDVPERDLDQLIAACVETREDVIELPVGRVLDLIVEIKRRRAQMGEMAPPRSAEASERVRAMEEVPKYVVPDGPRYPIERGEQK